MIFMVSCAGVMFRLRQSGTFILCVAGFTARRGEQ
jgi:hypothetical protein